MRPRIVPAMICWPLTSGLSTTSSVFRPNVPEKYLPTLVPSPMTDSDSTSCFLPPDRSAFSRVGLANRRSLLTESVTTAVASVAAFVVFLTALATLLPALAACLGAASAGSASSLATDALLCLAFLGTGTFVATFFRPA